MLRLTRPIRSLLILAIFLASCSNNSDNNSPVAGVLPGDTDIIVDTSTYSIIQTKIWNQNCVSCHVEGNSYARQSDLVLTYDVSYEQLINRQPNNEAAKNDGLLLLGTEGLPSLPRSFLWEKINARDREHFYSDHPFYGAQMPLGPSPLTNGELDYIKEWIIAGAPASGHVADTALLLDTSRYALPDFAPLDTPDNGYQFHIGPFQVPANTDYEFFYYEPQISNQDIYIKQVEITMRPGSHHFIAYTFNDDAPANFLLQSQSIREVYDPSGNYIIPNLVPTQWHQFVVGTQWPYMNYSFPPGVALRLPAGKGLDMNSHYANKTSSEITGEVYMNIHTLDENDVQYAAEILELNNQSLILPPNQKTTITKTYYFKEARKIFQLFSHAHEHMEEFRVYVAGGQRDGELIYVSYDWEHPPILEIWPPLSLHANEGLTLQVTYDNDEDYELKFGLRSTDEMMILFGAYY